MTQPLDEHNDKVKSTIETFIGASTTLKRRRKTEEDFNKEKFEIIIRTLEEIEVRSTLLEEDFNLGLQKYDDKFYTVIDNLLELYLGKEAMELVNFYLFDRISESDGEPNEVLDSTGNPVPLNNPSDLWDIIQFMKVSLSKKK
jgi:hypothetical protein